MSKRFIITFVIIIAGIIIAGLAAYGMASYSANQQNAEQTQQTTSESKNPEQANDLPLSTQPGAYVAYSNTVIADTKGTKVLFFHAPWCPQCRMIEADIKKQAALPDNTTIIKVDYDSNQALRQKYGVTLQTTFVGVDDSGNLVKKYVAYNEPNYAAVYDNILR